MATDHLGSTRVLLAGDGTVLDTVEYYPYGGLRRHPATPATTHLYTGHERDLGETGTQLDFMHARYYAPTLGRFLSVDPVGGQPGLSQSWNRYAYVRGNPILMVAPSDETISGSWDATSWTYPLNPRVRQAVIRYWLHWLGEGARRREGSDSTGVNR